MLAGRGRPPRAAGLWQPLAQAVPAGEIEQVLEIVCLRQRGDELCESLPEGQRKLLDVAMALMLNPKLLMLDEPTSGVSTDEKHGLMEIIMRALDERKVSAHLRRARRRHRHAATPPGVAAWIAGGRGRRRAGRRAGRPDDQSRT